MKNKTILKTLAALCVLAILISVLPASVLAEEMVEIPESDYIYVNGDNKVITLGGDGISVLRLVVENPGRVHILTSGVNIRLAVFDEGANELRDVYTSQYGLMDAAFYAAPGMYLLGLSGEGEVAVLAADEEATNQLYTEAAEQPSEVSVNDVVEDVPSEDSQVPVLDSQTPEETPDAPVAYDPSVPVVYQAALNETVSLLTVMREAGVSVEAVTWVIGDVDGRVISSPSSVLGEWLLTPYAYFDNISLTVKTIEDVTYTLILSCPAPAQEAESAWAVAEQPVEAPVEEPVEEPAEVTAEPEAAPAEVPAEEATSEPEAEAETEEPSEEPETEPTEAPAETEEKKPGFLTGFVNWLVGSSPDEEAEESSEEAEAESEEGIESEKAEAESEEGTEPEDAEAASEEGTEPEEPETGLAEEAADKEEAEVSDEAEESSEEPNAELEEEPSEVLSEETAEEEEEPETVVFDPAAPIFCEVTTNETISILPILTEAGAPVNIITNITGEVEGCVVLASQSNGDWAVTPYAYFDSVELTVTATDYTAEDSAAAEGVYTVILTNPNPDAVVEETVEEPEEGEALSEIEVTIAVERQEDNAIRLFADNIGEEEAEGYAYQWQYSLDGEEWLDVEGATEKDYAFQLDETNGKYYWRLIVSYQ